MSSGRHDRNSCITMGLCVGFLCHAKSPHTAVSYYYYANQIPQSLHACVDVFLAACSRGGLICQLHHVKDSVRWSLTLCLEPCRRDVFVSSTGGEGVGGGRSRADLIVCMSKYALQHQCAASPPHNTKATYFYS